MALKIELKGTSPGFADLAIVGGGTDPGPLEITIQRNQDEHYLAQDGAWQATPFTHSISSVVESPDGVLASVGPEIVDPIVACTGMAFLAQVRSAGIHGQTILKLSGRLLGSGAAGSGQADPAPPPPPPPVEPDPDPEPPEPAPVPGPEPEPPAPPPEPAKGGGSKTALWLGLVLLLLAIAAAVAWYLGMFGGSAEPAMETTSESVVESRMDDTAASTTDTMDSSDQAAQPEAGSQAAAQPSLRGRARAQAFLRGDLPPTPQSMLAKAIEWEQDGDCEASLIVLNAAAAMDVEASKALAERYDPASFRGDGCIAAADADTAAYWYEQPAEQGDQAAQSRLGLLLTERNQSGPLYERGVDYLRKAAQAGDPAAAERLGKLGEEP
jgi:hypothetical protein